MKKPVLYVLAALMLMIAVAAVACGDGDNGDNEIVEPTAVEEQAGQGGQEATPTAEATAEKATPEPTVAAESSGPLAAVPVYPGATEIARGDWSDAGSIPGAESMAPVLEGITDPDVQRLFSSPNIQFVIYETDDSPEDVVAWYYDTSEWAADPNKHAIQVFSGGLTPSAYVVWTEGPETAAWAVVGQVEGATKLGLWATSP